MASESGSKDFAVASRVQNRLFAEPYSFEFFQAVRLMQLFYPEHARVGFFQPPQLDVVHFGVNPSLGFPPSELYSLGVEEEGLKPLPLGAEPVYIPPTMRVNFMGLTGPSGVLPLYYTELAGERTNLRDRGLRDFLDIFHHRMISLFYRAWEKYRFGVPFERGEADNFSSYLLSLVGMGSPSLQDRQALNDHDYLYYAGLLAQQPRTAEGLELMLQDYFGVPVRVEQFLGAWYRLDEDSQCELDDEQRDSQQLGFGTVVGDEIWDPQSHARIVIGPLSLKQYRDFLPSGSAFEPLRTMVRFYAGDELDFEAQLILRKEETPACQLGGTDGPGPQLGWLSWAKTTPLRSDPSQTVLQL